MYVPILMQFHVTFAFQHVFCVGELEIHWVRRGVFLGTNT